MIALAKYYRKHISNLFKIYAALLEVHNEENVYNLRLAYKRIRAVNKFIKKELNGVALSDNHFDRLDDIYKSAGTIRELQINLKLLNKYGKILEKSFEHFTEYLNDKMITVNSGLRDQLNEASANTIEKIENKIYQHLAKNDEKYIRLRCIQHIKRKNYKVDNLLFDKSDKNRYHEIRTNIKEIIFFLKLLYKKQDYGKPDFDFNNLKSIAAKLGEWHDREILLNKLDDYVKSPDFKKPKSNYTVLLKCINKEQVKRLNNIDREIFKTILELNYFIGKKELELF